MKKILIIENDSLLVHDLVQSLKGMNCRVKTADTGFEGVKLLNKEHFDVVIIDLFTPGFDGRGVARHARLKRRNGAPIVLGLSDMSNLIKNDEFDHIISSPVSTNDIAEILNYCSGRRTIETQKDGAFMPV